jgi:hypothetical protein
MPLSVAEDQLLRHLYLEYGFPSDQYERRPAERHRFVEHWNDLSERNDTEQDVIKYIISERKQGRWVKFNGTHNKLASMPDDFLGPAEWGALRTAYTTVLVSRGLGSDNLRFDQDLGQALADEFKTLTGRAVNYALLLAAIEAKRKRGLWVKIGKRRCGFDDIDEVA